MNVASLWQDLESTLTPMLAAFRSRLDRLDVSHKADRSVLTEADLAVQAHIVTTIQRYDPGATIVAEETGVDHSAAATAQRVWVVDPIDGTAEFVKPGSTEYCSVICLLEDRRPTATLVVAPELGPDRSPLTIRVDGQGAPITVNGKPATTATPPALMSVTRKAGTPARPWEQTLAAAGYELKLRGTSQTLDMVRTCVDLDMPSFALFHRDRQKVWDGVAGMCLGYAAGLAVCDGEGRLRTAVDLDLTLDEPIFDSTLMAPAPLVSQFLAWTSVTPAGH